MKKKTRIEIVLYNGDQENQESCVYTKRKGRNNDVLCMTTVEVA